MLRFLFEILTDPLGLPLEAWKEYLILLAIGECAYIFAYYIVGSLYRDKDISTHTAGSVAHWGIRLITFIVMWAITHAIIWLVKHKEVTYIIITSILIGISIICLILRLILQRKGKIDHVTR